VSDIIFYERQPLSFCNADIRGRFRSNRKVKNTDLHTKNIAMQFLHCHYHFN